MTKASKNDWVEVEVLLLKPSERADTLPKETSNVPLLSYVQGYLINENGALGDQVQVRTQTNRKIQGKLINLSPKFEHDFGHPMPELLIIGSELRKFMTKGV
ncbi:2-amino-4-oxopentanoate thiolase subunit OrtA [Virgibacillus sp. W0181]|uniref:2-amino-4-oxopentanoate thiolase subunit OrtA n=1 Tax=Virgibacillus sp. W0181 TaxID=3391581 RepID=UPI003F46CF25